MSRYKPIYYIRMVITDTKSYSTYTQLSKVELYRNIDFFHLEVPISWDSTTVTCNKQAVTDEEGASNLIDGSVDTKACFDSGVPSSENPVIITFSNQEGFDFTPNEYDNEEYGVYKNPVYWKWYTANDSPERDPATFSLQISYDGIKWETVDGRDKDHWTVTDNRKAKAYNGEILLFPRHKPIDLNDLSYIKQYIDDNDLALDINTQTITTEVTLYDYDTYAEDSVSAHYVNIPNYTICGHSAVGIIIAIDIYYKIFIHSSSGCICVNRDNGSSWYELAFKSAIPTNISQLNNNRDFVNGIWIGDDFYEPFEDPVSPQEDAISVSLPEYPTSLPASDVYSWAKASTKPSYNASEVGALPNTGGTLTGRVIVKPDNSQGNFDEGIRLSARSDTGYFSFMLGAPHQSDVGTEDGAFWIGGNKYNLIRKLFIGHNASTQSTTYFHAESANDYSPKLHLPSGTIEHGNGDAVNGGAVFDYLENNLGTQTVSGNPITVADAESMNAESVVVELEPKQDLHGYDAPWVGGSGKNLLPYFTVEEKNGIRLTYDNGVVILNGTASANAFFILTNLNLASNNYVFSANNTTINNGVHVSMREIGADSDFADLPMNDSDKYNTYQNVSIGQVTLYVTSGTQLTNFRLPLQIEQGSTPTTFAPYSNICPITGYSEVNVERAGKNLLNPATFSHTNPNTGETDNNWAYWTYNNCRPETIYSLDCNVELQSVFVSEIKFYDKYYNNIGFDNVQYRNPNNITFTTPANVRYFDIAFYHDTSLASYDFTKAQVLEGSAIGEIIPYQSNTTTIDLDGTKYGGTLDVTEGVLTVDRAEVDLSSLTWEAVSRNRWNAHIDGMRPFENDFVTTAISDSFVATTMTQLYNDENYIAFACNNISDVYVRNCSTTDTPTGQLVYELETPLTIHLTPTQIQMLENTNNISTDGTNITLKYQPNNVIGECKAYTDEQIEKIPIPSGYKETIVWKYTGNEQAMPHGFPATTITIDNTTAPGFKLKKALRFYFRGYKMIVVPGKYPNYGLQSQDMLTAFMSSGDSYRVALQGSFINNTDIVYKRFASVTYTKTGDDESLEVAFDVCSNGNRTDNDYIIPLYITTVDYELDSLVSLS